MLQDNHAVVTCIRTFHWLHRTSLFATITHCVNFEFYYQHFHFNINIYRPDGRRSFCFRNSSIPSAKSNLCHRAKILSTALCAVAASWKILVGVWKRLQNMRCNRQNESLLSMRRTAVVNEWEKNPRWWSWCSSVQHESENVEVNNWRNISKANSKRFPFHFQFHWCVSSVRWRW